MAAAATSSLELGYAEESEAWRLESHFFPAKVGGRPSWLGFKPLPTSKDVQCGVCGEPCAFLAQIYAPLDNVRPTAFHRTIFVFVCRNADCCKANRADDFVALRCQLPRVNDFYSGEPLNIDEFSSENTPENVKRAWQSNDGKLCRVCRLAADKQCAKCKSIYYCCKSHQEIDWRLGGHKDSCGTDTSTAENISEKNKFSFPEYELVIENEHYVEQKTKERPESERLKSYKEYVETAKRQSVGNEDVLPKESVQELEAMAKRTDKDFKLFRRRLDQNPDQVLRYERGGTPLWADSEATPRDGDVPACEFCKAPRIFEFQIMPRMLSYLDVDCVGKSLDWATVAVYTCRDSCDAANGQYVKEFVWKQDYRE